jgi:hypothetical protein
VVRLLGLDKLIKTYLEMVSQIRVSRIITTKCSIFSSFVSFVSLDEKF